MFAPPPPPPPRRNTVKPMVIFDNENNFDSDIVDFGPKQSVSVPKDLSLLEASEVQTLEDFTDQDVAEAQETIPDL